MENWRFVKEVLAVVAIMATVFLAYSDVTEANAVQDVEIVTLKANDISLKEDLVKRLDRIEDQVNEIRKNQERDN